MSAFIRDRVISDIQLSVREKTHAYQCTELAKIIMKKLAWKKIKRVM